MISATTDLAPGRPVLSDARWLALEIEPLRGLLSRYLRRRFKSIPDPEDVVQEALMRILRLRQSGEPIQLVKPLLFRIARNVAIDVIRRQSRAPFLDITYDCACLVPTDAPSIRESVSRRQEVELLRTAISELPPRCRLVMQMRVIQGLPIKEVAAKLGIGDGTVESQLCRGYAFCRAYLHERCRPT